MHSVPNGQSSENEQNPNFCTEKALEASLLHTRVRPHPHGRLKIRTE